MKNKKVLMAAASTALVAVVGIGATLAYFTDQASTENVVTMGHVDIRLVEYEVTKDENGDSYVTDTTKPVTEKGLTFTDVYPGETLPKDPTVELVSGSGDAYVRVRMEIDTTKTKIDAEDVAALRENINNEIAESGDWYYNAEEDYYYYNAALTDEEGKNAATLFENVTIPGEEWTNNTADQTFAIKLHAEAIQREYFTPEATDGMITSWGNVTPETYEAQ